MDCALVVSLAVGSHRDCARGSAQQLDPQLRLQIEAAASVIGIDRVGVRISPSGEFGGMVDSDNRATPTIPSSTRNSKRPKVPSLIQSLI
jgi:hypothetical protein